MDSTVPQLKNLDPASDASLYMFYEPGQQHILLSVENFSAEEPPSSILALKRVPGEKVSDLEWYKNKFEDLDVDQWAKALKPGMYVFDVVVFANRYMIVDVLYDNKRALDECTYLERLEHLHSLFDAAKVPRNVHLKSLEKHRLDSYGGLRTTLIAKEMMSTLKYNTDYRYTAPPKIYKIVGKCEIMHRVKNQPAAADDANVAVEATATVAKVAPAAYSMKPTTVYLVADVQNNLFGWSMVEVAYAEPLQKKYANTNPPVEYNWVVPLNAEKYMKVQYFDAPSVASFTVKNLSRTDLAKLQLHRIVCDRATTYELDLMPLTTIKQRHISLPEMVLQTLNGLNLVTFKEDMKLYNEHVKSLKRLWIAVKDEDKLEPSPKKRRSTDSEPGSPNRRRRQPAAAAAVAQEQEQEQPSAAAMQPQAERTVAMLVSCFSSLSIAKKHRSTDSEPGSPKRRRRQPAAAAAVAQEQEQEQPSAAAVQPQAERTVAMLVSCFSSLSIAE